MTDLSFRGGRTHLRFLDLNGNHFTNVTLLPGLTNLIALLLSGNELSNFSFLSGLPSLTILDLSSNQLVSLSLPPGLTNLINLDLSGNRLSNFSFLSELTRLTPLDISWNQLSSFTLPTAPANLTSIGFDGNPLTTLVLPEPLAVTSLAPTVASLKSQDGSVYPYPLGVELSLVSSHRTPATTYGFVVTGPPAAYTILGSTDLAAWNELGRVTNSVGVAIFTDLQVTNSSQKFYRARLAP